MKSMWKKAAALILALALCLSFAGCYSEANTWAAKKGDDTLPIGGYIFYLYSAYSDAREEVSTETNVLDATIDDKDAQTWLRDKAMDYVNSYYFISTKFDDLGLELTQDELDEAQSYTDTYWTYNKTTLEEMGIAKDSYYQAMFLYNAKLEKVRNAVYGEGGEMEVTEDEMKEYYTDNYVYYEYFYAPLTTTDEEGSSVSLTDDEKDELKNTMTSYADKINDGVMTTEEAAEAFAEETAEETTEETTEEESSDEESSSSETASASTYTAPNALLKENISTEIAAALEEVGEGESVFAETDSYYFVLHKLSIADAFEEVYADETQKEAVLINMKGDEFSDYVEEQAKSVEGVELNEKAINKVKIKKVVTEGSESGTSSASSEVEDESSESSQTEE